MILARKCDGKNIKDYYFEVTLCLRDHHGPFLAGVVYDPAIGEPNECSLVPELL